jgi:hypothetical protein
MLIKIMEQPRQLPIALLLLLLGSSAARGLDHGNLDEDRPLRMEDAYPIAQGELALEGGFGFTVERHASDRALFPFEILYGAWTGLQVGAGTVLSTDPHDIDDTHKSGDLRFSALYNFNQETESLPAFGVKGTLNLPTGTDSSGADFELKGLVTKSFDRWSLHFNPAYEFLSGGDGGERDGRYRFILGASYPLGAPQHTRTTLLFDLFAEQSSRSGESTFFGAEAGVRYQMSQRGILDFGLGSEMSGPSRRAPFYFTAGFSYGF